MSDQKKYEQMMSQHVDRQLQRQWNQQYSPQAVRHFSRPALICEICGNYMYVNPETGRNYEMSEQERKWSIHSYCKDQVERQLDSVTFKGRPR